jgi:hypothetical protein
MRWMKEKDEIKFSLLLAKESSLSIISLTTYLGCLASRDKSKKITHCTSCFIAITRLRGGLR